ncbi:MAG TPA: hypothetical protein VFU15_06120, partial [Bacteroidia bacterium]|nr:hypothetical protein [Bacteroidia bacterium]
MMAKVFAAHPDIKAQFDANERLAEKQDSIDFSHNYYRQSQQAMMPTVYTVPVVFHIIHQYGSENISDAQVLDEMRILNEDYAKLNPDTTAIESSFVSIAASANIQFKLANIDPNGNCTNGIDRVYSYLTNAADDNSKLDPWPR